MGTGYYKSWNFGIAASVVVCTKSVGKGEEGGDINTEIKTNKNVIIIISSTSRGRHLTVPGLQQQPGSLDLQEDSPPG